MHWLFCIPLSETQKMQKYLNSTYSFLAGGGTYKEKRDFAIINAYKSVA